MNNANVVLNIYNAVNESTHGNNLRINGCIRHLFVNSRRYLGNSVITNRSIFLLKKKHPEVGGAVHSEMWLLV